MTNVGRYWECPAKIRIRGNRRTFRQWLLRKFFREDRRLYFVSNCEQPYYPGTYKK